MPPANPATLTEETIRRALGEFQLDLSGEQILKIQQYIRILLVWNEKLNLTAIRDPLEILYRHFCESMYAAVAVPVENGRLADVGSGGGFPGLPLKIIRPDLQVFLIESNLKKATFLAEVSRELGLADTRVLVRRYEELGEELAPLDFVCSRALGEFRTFLAWAGSEHVAAKEVILWIGARDLEEIQRIPGWDWREPISIPHSLRRMLLVGKRKTRGGESAASGEDASATPGKAEEPRN
jgi:16S rRNA (guanine527-N7)-methyltransferase